MFTLMLSMITIYSCSNQTSDQSFDDVKIETRSTTVIAEMNSAGQYVFTSSKGDFIDDWNVEITSTGTVIEDIVLRANEDGALALYGLVTNADGDFIPKSVKGVTVTGTTVYFTDGGGGMTTTCSGCTTIGPDSAEHCIPTLKDGTTLYYCSDCPTNNCTRSVSTTT